MDEPAAPASYLLSRWLFLRLLGVVYLIAFASLAVQVTGLVGEHGLLPARAFLERAALGLRGSGLPAPAHRLLARCRRPRSPARRLGRRRPGGPAHPRPGAASDPGPALGALPLAHGGRPGLPLVPVGRVAARGRPARDPLGARSDGCLRGRQPPASTVARWLLVFLLFKLMFLSGAHQALERGPDVAERHGPRLPLRDSAAAALDGVVRAQPAGVGASCGHHRDVRDRIGSALAPPRALPAAADSA